MQHNENIGYNLIQLIKAHELFDRYHDLLPDYAANLFSLREIEDLGTTIHEYSKKIAIDPAAVLLSSELISKIANIISVCEKIRTEAIDQYQLAYQDKSKAFNHFKKAAKLKHADAQNQLALCYQYGRGVLKDYEKAVKYFQLAAAQGHNPAKGNLMSLERSGMFSWGNKKSELGTMKLKSSHTLDDVLERNPSDLSEIENLTQNIFKLYSKCFEMEDSYLHIAILNNDMNTVSWLLKQGADIKKKNKYGSTVAHYAAIVGNINILKLIIEKDRTLLNANNNCGGNPLILAVSKGHEEAVTYLLDQTEILIDAADHDGKNALHYAIDKKNINMIQKLILKGAKVSIDDVINTKDELKQILFESLEKSPKLKQFLEEKVGEDENSWLRVAILNNDLDIVNWLFLQGADIKIRNKYGSTVAHFAAFVGDINILKLIIERDRTLLNAKNNCGDHPLIFAVSKGHEKVVKYLLEQPDILIDAIGDDGKKAINYAIDTQNINIIRNLILKGAKVSADDMNNAKDEIKQILFESLEKSATSKTSFEEKVTNHYPGLAFFNADEKANPTVMNESIKACSLRRGQA